MTFAAYVLEKWRMKGKSQALRNHLGNMNTDPIADLLTRIRNAQMARLEVTVVPYSKMKFSIAQILERRGFVKNVELKGRGIKRVIQIGLKYRAEGTPRVLGLKRVSKPGQRKYSDVLRMHKVKGGTGIAIISTSKGLMSDIDARKEKIGGEVICEVW